jgi:accessory gene regulator protein AgrB
MLPNVYIQNATVNVAEDNMARINLKTRATTKANMPEVTEHLEKQQKGFIVILLLLTILLVVITPVGCATLLALLTGVGAGTGAAAAP